MFFVKKSSSSVESAEQQQIREVLRDSKIIATSTAFVLAKLQQDLVETQLACKSETSRLHDQLEQARDIVASAEDRLQKLEQTTAEMIYAIEKSRATMELMETRVRDLEVELTASKSAHEQTKSALAQLQQDLERTQQVVNEEGVRLHEEFLKRPTPDELVKLLKVSSQTAETYFRRWITGPKHGSLFRSH